MQSENVCKCGFCQKYREIEKRIMMRKGKVKYLVPDGTKFNDILLKKDLKWDMRTWRQN
jgi:hypothetical protein